MSFIDTVTGLFMGSLQSVYKMDA